MYKSGQLIFWLVVGTLIGFGWGGLASIGLPFLLIGIILLVYGLMRFGPAGVWAALIGFGVLPAFLILYGDRLYGPPDCPFGRGLTIIPDEPGSTHVACGQIPASYVLFVAFYGVVALVGMIWGLVTTLRRT